MSAAIFTGLQREPDHEAIRFEDAALTYRGLAEAASGVAERLSGARSAAVVAEPSLDTCVSCVGAIAAGVPVVPLNPGTGEKELVHVLRDSCPEVLLAPADAAVPEPLRDLPRISPGQRGSKELSAVGNGDETAMILYTSGTTGLPKGVLIPRRAIATNLDAIAAAWGWTASDRLVHALPLFHVHGLVLGILGPLRRGASVEHLGRFSPEAVARGFERGATMLFGVPTMYHRLADAAEADGRIRAALGRARLLISGSAPLPATLHRRIERLTGQRIVERYGMTETLMICSFRVDGERSPGYVGPPVEGVDVRLVDDAGTAIQVDDDQTLGEVQVKGPNLFSGYLNQPEATAASTAGDWFRTGDIATRRASGDYRIVGRRSTDLIKSGGFRIGAGEVEAAMLDHPDVQEVAVAGLTDPDLGQRVTAWVVLRDGAKPNPDALIQHVAGQLSAHKRPRTVHFVDELPRNELGKVIKARLVGTAS